MPNGGSDCCGTCWFNRKNKGEAGYGHTKDPEPAYCDIRDLAIEHPFYTYCGNHPHRIPWKLRVPIGPVYTGDCDGNREVWVDSPDNEEVRSGLLDLLGKLPDMDADEYPIGPMLGEVVIAQLANLGEQRAIPELRRIAAMEEGPPDRFANTNGEFIEMAKWALEHLGAGKRRPHCSAIVTEP